jgi:hypothetical protein
MRGLARYWIDVCVSAKGKVVKGLSRHVPGMWEMAGCEEGPNFARVYYRKWPLLCDGFQGFLTKSRVSRGSEIKQ